MKKRGKLKLKVKNAYLGGFLVKIEKNKYVFGKEMKSLLYKSTLIFFLGGSEKELRAYLYFFGDTPSGPFPHTKKLTSFCQSSKYT